MSNINTSSIDNNYPIPGVNNNTQGFRDNFTNIKNNLETAKVEITDLQNKAIVKASLLGGVLDNDMNNTVISNAQTKGFRGSTNSISAGNIPSTVTINVNNGDVQYGTIVENTTINFGGWSPTNTESRVRLVLNFANSSALLNLPITTFDSSANVVSGMKNSVRQLENYASNGVPASNAVTINQLTVPLDVKELILDFSSTDCGTTIDVTPVNRNQLSTQIQLRQPTSFGSLGDFPGAICTYDGYLYVCIDRYATIATLNTTSASGNGTHATLTFASQNVVPFKAGSQIYVTGVTPTEYNGTYTITAASQSSVTYSPCTATGSQTVSGTVSAQKIIWTKTLLAPV